MLEFLKLTKKDPYSPSQTKRYKVADDGFSRERARVLRDIHHELEEEFGMQISFSIFGSLVKGKKLTKETASRADIDMFIDLDLPDENFKTFLIDIGNGRAQSRLDELKYAFISKLNEHRKQLSLSWKNVMFGHINARPINDQTFLKVVKGVKKLPTKDARLYLASFFTLSIGSVINKYRNKFLGDLARSANSVEAEEIWQIIKTSVEQVERSNNITDGIAKQFPQTLKEALKFYGVKIE